MRFFCSKCGLELVHIRKAIPGKGYIANLINPHKCEGFGIKDNKKGKPTLLDIIESLKPLGKTVTDSSRRSEDANLVHNFRDNRSDVKSTAPDGILRSMRDLATTEKEDIEE